jgi:hypothetical protein
MKFETLELDLADGVSPAPFVGHELVPRRYFERNWNFSTLTGARTETSALLPVQQRIVVLLCARSLDDAQGFAGQVVAEQSHRK